MPRMCLGMSNFAQSAEVTLDAIKAALNAQPTLKDNAILESVRDGDTGKIIETNVTLPTGVSQSELDAAFAAIERNPGVARATSIPNALAFTDLDATAGLVTTGSPLSGSDSIFCSISEDLTNSPFLVPAGRLVSTGYEDFGSSLSPAGTILRITSFLASPGYVLNTGELTVKTISGANIPVVLASSLTLIKGTGFGGAFVSVWVGADGKVYLHQRGNVSGFPNTPQVSYADAVAAGAI